MLHRSGKPKRPRDVNELAFLTVQLATGQTTEEPEAPAKEGKMQAAVELGRLGGKKGGPARAQSMTPERRSEIAKKAADARWHGKR